MISLADGTKIAFDSNRDGNDEVYVMNADGTNRTNNLLTDTRPDWGVAPAVTPPPPHHRHHKKHH